MSKAPTCEVCGHRMVPIVYGYPDDKTMKQAQEGKIALGGCVIGFNDPKWACTNCPDEEDQE